LHQAKKKLWDDIKKITIFIASLKAHVSGINRHITRMLIPSRLAALSDGKEMVWRFSWIDFSLSKLPVIVSDIIFHFSRHYQLDYVKSWWNCNWVMAEWCKIKSVSFGWKIWNLSLKAPKKKLIFVFWEHFGYVISCCPRKFL
jgi:hypothetical protein